MPKRDRFIKYCDSDSHFVKRELHSTPLYYSIYTNKIKLIGSFYESANSFFLDRNGSFASRHYYLREIYFVFQLKRIVKKYCND